MRCFNEAGATTPRKQHPVSVAYSKHNERFNEAGATTPRKQETDERPYLIAHSFNEAGATTPRKPGVQGYQEIEELASMRPGQQRPGNLEEARVVAGRPLLQ